MRHILSKKGINMIQAVKTTELVKSSKRGVRYATNPFIGDTSINTKIGTKRISNKDGAKMMVINEGTGEYIAPAGFWQAQEVDKTQFIKLFVNGVKAFKDLTSSGTKVFEVLYLRMQEAIGKDSVWLTYPSLDESTPMATATFYRGMKELLDKGFIAESEIPGNYFINPDYCWNGDRLAFVKEYRLKSSKTPKDQSERDALEARGQHRLIQ